MGKDKRHWTVRLPETDRQYLQAEAARGRRSMASVLLQALQEYRQRQERRARLDEVLDAVEIGPEPASAGKE